MKIKKTLAGILSVTLLFGAIPADHVVAAKKISMSKKLSLTTGKTKTLKVKNTKKKVKWKIVSGKKYISIKKKGKQAVTVKGRKKGTAKIRATVDKKKLTCKVTVKNAKEPQKTDSDNTPVQTAAAPGSSTAPSSSVAPGSSTAPGSSATPDNSDKNADDVAALQELIRTQRANGATVDEDISNKDQYTWENGRLVGINWGSQGLSGKLDVTPFSALETLYCSWNQLSSLDISNNTALVDLDCYSNQLSSLDVSHNTALVNLRCGRNQLSSLDVSNNTVLYNLRCDDDVILIGYTDTSEKNAEDVAALKELIRTQRANGATVDEDISTKYQYTWENGRLVEIRWHDQLLSGKLDVTPFSALKTLECGQRRFSSNQVTGNQLTSLDVSHNTALTRLECDSNQLTSLDVSNNTALEFLECSGNQLTSLDVSNNTALKYLNCGSNQLTSLDVSHNTALTQLECYRNQLSSLDVSHNTALLVLDCSDNQLSSLDVSHNTALLVLGCSGNQLSSLDLSNNTALEYLSCDGNELSSLDLTNNTKLEEVECDDSVTLIGYNK